MRKCGCGGSLRVSSLSSSGHSTPAMPVVASASVSTAAEAAGTMTGPALSTWAIQRSAPPVSSTAK